ncbi:virulence factor Mce family protein [Amycolatopsis arida]|uniref:Virulence factor Mce family protein n=1 Tax=Amycolatopsis arida TaxID=587909 RepID=A0A1I5R031_9PSEU|nr:MCE family protein [Amycolatopsis arida]TDX99024.1 virulence factor Mce-like protein [Amycolatopsis arida]SFP51859.1 virulence factor Mce family protein [Amycolatopsis arida]
MTGARGRRLGHQLAGVAFGLIIVLLCWLAIAVYEKKFTTVVPVTLQASHAGNQLEANADVKVRGLRVGEVRAVRSTGSGAEIELALDPAHVHLLPANVSARLLPKSLFGQRYIDLVLPEHPAPRPLAAGDVIGQDRSSTSIELERVLDDLLPLLQAVQPEKLAATLGALAQALDGRGEQIGDTVVRLDTLLAEVNPQLPQVRADISLLADVAGTYTTAAPDILRALADLTVPSTTLAERSGDLTALIGSVNAASAQLSDFLHGNRENFVALSAASRTTLELLAEYAPEFPCLFRAVDEFRPRMDRAFGKGTGEPGLHVSISIEPKRDKYVPGRDDPKPYHAGGGPRCYPVPGSAGQERLITELTALASGTTPAEVAPWGGLLLGPLLRGTEVTLR